MSSTMETPKAFVNCDKSENIAAQLKNRIEEEGKVNMQLEELLMKQCTIEKGLNVIGLGLNSLKSIRSDCNHINDQIDKTAKLAERVSAKVRRLDMARTRASECQQRVHDLIDLQLCSQGVLKALSDENYEMAAGHIARFLAMDQNMLQRTADDVQGSITSVSNAVCTLENATEKLRDLTILRFEESVKNDDIASVERFFKIFPLVGYHDIGIKKFSNYLCTKISTRAQKELNNTLDLAKAEKRVHLAYADSLTTLLENFARVIEINQPIVEAFYGKRPNCLLDMVTILQQECDIEVKNLLKEFINNRQITQLKQKVMESQRGYVVGTNISSGIQPIDLYKPSQTQPNKLYPKDIDAINTEITVMHSRVELYFRFIRRRTAAYIDASSQDKHMKQEHLNQLNAILIKSEANRKIQELLNNYLLFERYFMEESVIKAIAMDACDSGQQCSSMVDDVFFIIRKCIRRALSTQSVNGTCAVINNAATCLECEFITALKTPLKNGYPSGYIDISQAIQSKFQTVKLHSNDSDKARIHFLTQLNNADVATEYIDTLWQTVEEEIKGTFITLTPIERQLLDSCLGELKAISDALKSVVDMGLQQLRSSAVKPRLNPWIDEFSNYSHILSEEELLAYQAGDTFVQLLIVQLEGLLNSFKNHLSPRNYDALVSILTTEVTTRLERVIKKSSFNRLGGLILDQEIRSLTSYLTSATSWSIRDKMTRLSQIATLLNMEKVSELSDYWNPENSRDVTTWRLTANEVRTILTLRTDFRMEDIKRLQI